MSRARLVTLTSDLGAAYAAQVKAVLYRSLPPERVVDLLQEIPAHHVDEGAFLLSHLAASFPAGTVHLAVVDPGVGGERLPIVIDCRDGSRLVGPDNGLLSPLADRLGVRAAYQIDPDRLGLTAGVSPTFAGRDLFAPVAARLAKGLPPRSVGPKVRPRRFEVRPPARTAYGARGIVVHIDRFGNAVTNVPTDWAPGPGSRISVRLGPGRERDLPRAAVYEALPKGRLGVVGSSFGLLELALREGRASDRLRLSVRRPVRFGWRPRRSQHR